MSDNKTSATTDRPLGSPPHEPRSDRLSHIPPSPRPKIIPPRPESEFTYITELDSKHCQIRQHRTDEDYEIICNGEKFFRTYDSRGEVLAIRDILERGLILYESCRIRRGYMQSIGRLDDYLRTRQTCELSISEESLWNGHHLGIDDMIAWDNSIVSGRDIRHISEVILRRREIIPKKRMDAELTIFKEFFERALRSYQDNAPSMVASK